MFRKAPAAALMTFIALGLGGHPATASTAIELKTADREIPGTREIEAGNYAAGIAKLERALNRPNHSVGRAPALINLCVAFVATQQLERAARYCDAAVANGISLELAYNNRAVLKLVRGDLQAAVADLEKAALLKPGTNVVQRNLDRARARAQARVASSQD